jgi:hypothetical protein
MGIETYSSQFGQDEVEGPPTWGIWQDPPRWAGESDELDTNDIV